MRMRQTVRLAFALSALVACGANESPKPEMPAALPAAAPSPAAPASSDKTNAEPAPTLVLRVVRSTQGVGLRVINAGSEPVSLAPQVALLGASDGKSIDAQALQLQMECKSQGCVKLAPGAELDAPSWLERVAAERCGALLTPAPGNYRLRVQTCAGAHQAETEFSWPVQ